MKVAAVANAMETYSYQKNKLQQQKDDLIEMKLLDSVYGKNDEQVKHQEIKIAQSQKELKQLLNTDIDKVPPLIPEFDIRKQGKTLNILG